MRKILLSVAIMILAATVFTSCQKVVGRGDVVTETREISGFNKVKSEFGGDVIITPGNTFEVKIEAQQNVIDVTETILSGNTLTIKIRNNTIIKHADDVTVYITMPTITGAEVQGSGDINLYGDFISVDHVKFTVMGSGDISATRIEANQVEVDINGSGKINIDNGSTQSLEADIDGSGSVYTSNMPAVNGDIDISGSGNAEIWVTGHLDAKISGSGSIYYKGNPTINVDISGSGKVKGM